MALTDEDLMAISNLMDQKICPINSRLDRMGHKHGKHLHTIFLSTHPKNKYMYKQ